MSPKNPSLIAGLAAPGLFWLATTVANGQDLPSLPGPSSPAPTSTSATYTVLLLSNGTVVKGEITEDPATGDYKLRQSGGQVPYLRRNVKKAAGSIEEIYDFLVAGLPVGDPDERMKLVRWCLTEHLPAQAKEQLAQIVAMCPDDREARMMLINMKVNADHAAKADPAIRQTALDLPAVDNPPAALNPGVIKKLRKGYGQQGPPEIFDLTRAQAMQRANEFAEFIHPILQKNCAGCHNERYQGPFQLVVVKSKREFQNSDITRTNLDAALRLVNIDDLPRSDLLTLSLVPHGPVKGAIFKGPIDPQYRDLATWVKSMKPAKNQAKAKSDNVNRTGYTPTDATAGEGFASDRGGKGAAGKEAGPSGSGLPDLPGMDLLNQSKSLAPAPPSRREFRVYDEDADFSGGYGDDQFQKPWTAGGPPPRNQAQAGPSKAAPPKAARLAKPLGPDAVVVDPNTNLNDLPGMDQPLYRTSPKAATEGEAKPDAKAEAKPDPKAKKKIDPALLEEMMRKRNGTP